MKHLIVLSLLLIPLTSYAGCSLDGLSTVCSVAEFQKSMDTTYSTKPIVNEFSDSPEARLKPSKNEADRKMLREFSPKDSDYSYNADCQFGVCYDKGAKPAFQQQKQ